MKYLISVIDQLNNPGTAAEMIEIDKFNDSLRANWNLDYIRCKRKGLQEDLDGK